jgi:hypothetical protein
MCSPMRGAMSRVLVAVVAHASPVRRDTMRSKKGDLYPHFVAVPDATMRRATFLQDVGEHAQTEFLFHREDELSTQ